MEVYVYVAGNKESLERWEKDLSSKFYPVWKNGKRQPYAKRLLVAPMIPYKIATYKENLPALMNDIGTQSYILERYPLLNKACKWFRKMLKLKPVPKPTNPNPLMQPEQVQKAVAVIPIGIKDDFIGIEGEQI